MNRYFLGIDTSNYTTSVALVDESENVISEKSLLLQVKKGMKGLRQQEALFQHVEHLPKLLNQVLRDINPSEIRGIGVSDKPRNTEGSYMPCFRAGSSMGKALAEALKIPYCEFSHQEGHIAAVVPGNMQEYLCYHISGGTCELLYINDKSSEVIGGSLDISFGQLIDRVGIALGYSFPYGKIMDKKALDEENIDEIKPVKMKDSYFNLSGTETKLMNILKDYTEEEISGAVFHAVSKCIYASATAGLAKIGKKMPVALVGGVACSRYIREYLKDRDLDFVFGEYSSDNAVGIALLGKRSISNNSM